MLWFCFVQAEDGIRDLVRSRGLGDVYKRQALVRAEHPELLFLDVEMGRMTGFDLLKAIAPQQPVSYTHLTLPTSDLV